MSRNPIANIPQSRIRIWVLQPDEPRSVLYHDLSLGYLLTTLVDDVGCSLYDIAVNYVPYSRKGAEYYASQLEKYPEEYHILFMENYFHSADYAFKFVEFILDHAEKADIKSKFIIFSHKTEDEDARKMIERYKSISVFAQDDIEYLFYALFKKKSDIKDIPNVFWRDSADGVIHSSMSADIVNIDLNEYIRWAYHNGYYTHFSKSKDFTINLLDSDNGSESPFFEMNLPKTMLRDKIRRMPESVMLSSGRWCKYKCSYCYRWVKYSNVRQVSLETIEKDLAFLKELGYTNLCFYDDCFLTTNENRIDEMIALMKKYDFTYEIAIRFEMLKNEHHFDLLTQLKISYLQIWVQSIKKEVNKFAKRWFNDDVFWKIIQKLQDKDIYIGFDVILWLPEDTISGFIETMRYALELKPNTICINTLYLNPRTEVYRKMSEYGIIPRTTSSGEKRNLFKAPTVGSSYNFSQEDIRFGRSFLVACAKKIPSIHFVIR